MTTKYAGSISIYDDNGQEVWGRDLTQDEIIDAILTPQEATEEVEETPAPKKKKKAKAAEVPGKKKGQKVCKICGTPGHIAKTCSKGNSRGLPNAATRKEEEENSALAPEVRERIKDMRDRDLTSTEIAKELAAELNMDFEAMKAEVQKVVSRGAGNYLARGESSDEAAGAAVAEPLTREEYDQLRDAMYDREFQSAQYSLVNKLPPREINAAIKSEDYAGYIANRS